MRLAIHPRCTPDRCSEAAPPSPVRRTPRGHFLGAVLLFSTALALAQTPGPPAADAPDAGVDAALMARASGLVYTREVARARAAQGVDTNRMLVGRARRAESHLLANAATITPAAADWTWGMSVETRAELVAWSVPNGAVLISTGLIQRLSLTDAELAAILAHVIAHQLAGHDARDVVAAYRRRHENPDPDRNRVMVELVDILGKVIQSPHYDAADETAADALALELLARSGIDPRAAVSAWRKVAQSDSATAPGFLALHPTPPERIAGLEAELPVVIPLYEQALADAAAAPKPAAKKKKSEKKPTPRWLPRQR